MEATATTLGVHHKMYAVSIPAAASPFVNLGALLRNAGHDTQGHTPLGCGIFPVSADYRASTDSSGSPFYTVPSGDGYTQPATYFADDTWVRASAGAAIAAVVVVFWKT